MSATTIEWATDVWNPIIGCTRVSRGCEKCYAERQGFRVAAMGITKKVGGEIRWTGEVRFVEEALDLPLRWRRPRRIFVNSMSDLFHEKVQDKWIDQIYAVMMLSDQHEFQILTKRPERFEPYFGLPSRRERWARAVTAEAERFGRKVSGIAGPAAIAEGLRGGWRGVPNNVWLGVSVENQATADVRIPLLLQTPAAVRWVSYEPALGPVAFAPYLWVRLPLDQVCGSALNDAPGAEHGRRLLDWLVLGGESGPDARPFDLAWARSAIAQCRTAGVPVFVKQLGSLPVSHDVNDLAFDDIDDEGMAGAPRGEMEERPGPYPLALRDRKAADPAEWPEDLRGVRDWP